MTEILTLLLALYGAGVSTVLAVKELRQVKRRIQVRCSFGLASPAEGVVGEVLAIEAVNTGFRPINIIQAGLYLDNGMRYIPISRGLPLPRVPLPKKLEDNDNVSVVIPLEDLKRMLKEQGGEQFYTSAFVSDAEGNVYKCKLPAILEDRKLSRPSADRRFAFRLKRS